MADNTFEVQFKTTYDGAGAQTIAKDLANIQAAAKETGKTALEMGGNTKSGAREAADGTGALDSALGTLRGSSKSTLAAMKGLSLLMRGDVMGAIKGVAVETKALSGVMAGTPIGLVVTALALGVAAWQKYATAAKDAGTETENAGTQGETAAQRAKEAAEEAKEEYDAFKETLASIATGFEEWHRKIEATISANERLAISSIKLRESQGEITSEQAKYMEAEVTGASKQQITKDALQNEAQKRLRTASAVTHERDAAWTAQTKAADAQGDFDATHQAAVGDGPDVWQGDYGAAAAEIRKKIKADKERGASTSNAGPGGFNLSDGPTMGADEVKKLQAQADALDELAKKEAALKVAQEESAKAKAQYLQANEAGNKVESESMNKTILLQKELQAERNEEAAAKNNAQNEAKKKQEEENKRAEEANQKSKDKARHESDMALKAQQAQQKANEKEKEKQDSENAKRSDMVHKATDPAHELAREGEQMKGKSPEGTHDIQASAAALDKAATQLEQQHTDHPDFGALNAAMVAYKTALEKAATGKQSERTELAKVKKDVDDLTKTIKDLLPQIRRMDSERH